MEKYYVSKDTLSDIYDVLWAECEAHDGEFIADPSLGCIKVKKDDAIVAEIYVIEVTDEYDLKRKLFNEDNL